MSTFYEILGVAPTATPEEIRKAFFELVKKWHPDKNSSNQEEATKKTQAINEAHEILSDPNKRSEYDKKLQKNNKKSSDSVSEETTSVPKDDSRNKSCKLSILLKIFFAMSDNKIPREHILGFKTEQMIDALSFISRIAKFQKIAKSQEKKRKIIDKIIEKFDGFIYHLDKNEHHLRDDWAKTLHQKIKELFNQVEGSSYVFDVHENKRYELEKLYHKFLKNVPYTTKQKLIKQGVNNLVYPQIVTDLV